MPTEPTNAQPPAAPAGFELASWLRRIAALVVDWIASTLVVYAIAGTSSRGLSSFYPLVVFWLECGVGTAVVGASFGQLVARVRVLRTDGRPVSLLMALLRSLLVCLVIPPLVFRPDGRGLHDLATDSAAYRLPTSR